MILIDYDDSFLKDKISNLLIQNDIKFTLNKKEKFFTKVLISQNQDYIKINSQHNNMITLKIPVSVHSLMTSLLDFIKDIKIDLKYFSYKPILQEVSTNSHKTILGNIHNVILSNLILNEEIGIKNSILYQKIWPKDKEISINKLDTHLTNLKNKLHQNLNLKINIITNDGQIKLIMS